MLVMYLHRCIHVYLIHSITKLYLYGVFFSNFFNSITSGSVYLLFPRPSDVKMCRGRSCSPCRSRFMHNVTWKNQIPIQTCTRTRHKSIVFLNQISVLLDYLLVPSL